MFSVRTSVFSAISVLALLLGGLFASGNLTFRRVSSVIPLPVPQLTLGTSSTTPVVTPPSGDAGQVPPASVGKLITASVIHACLGKSGKEQSVCLDDIFRNYLKSYSTIDALAQLQRLEDTDQNIRLSCHPVGHAIGRETFLKTKTVHDSFAACDQTCHSGCYHGAMERFLRGDGESEEHITTEELREKAASACDSSLETRFRFQCLHGLGHALIFFSDYNLFESLKNCDATGDAWSRSSCYGGAFMENVFSASPEKRDLSPTDYHYPCSKLESKYRPDCYMMQTTRMTEMGLSTAQLFVECTKAGNERSQCMQSIGRDLSNNARIGNPASVARDCERGELVSDEQACIRGVAYALVDNTWDGRYAFPFCKTFTDPNNVSYCYSTSQSYLRSTFVKTSADLVAECAKYVPDSVLCREIAEN